MIFLKVNLPNVVQFKRYWGKSKPRVVLFKARFFSNHYYEYKQFTHTDTWMVKKCRVKFDHWTTEPCASYYYWRFCYVLSKCSAVQTKTSKFGIQKQNTPIGTRIPVNSLFLTWLKYTLYSITKFQSRMTFERNLGGQFSPVTAPFPFHDASARSAPSFFFARSLTAPLPLTEFSALSALFFAPIPLRLHALLVNNQSRQRAISAALTHQVALTTVLASKLWIPCNLSRLRCGVPNSKLLQ